MITKLNEGETYKGPDADFDEYAYDENGYESEEAYAKEDDSINVDSYDYDNEESAEYDNTYEEAEYDDGAKYVSDEELVEDDIAPKKKKRKAKRKSSKGAKKPFFNFNHGNLGFFPEVIYILRDGANFKGRTPRREFLLGFFPIYLLVNSLLLFVSTRIESDVISFLLTSVSSLLLLMWATPICIRRLHDAGRSNRFIVFFAGLLLVAPLYIILALFTVKDASIIICILIMAILMLVGAVALLVPMFLFVSEVGENEWGIDPMDEENDKYADYGMIPQIIVFVVAVAISVLLIFNSTPENVLRGAGKYMQQSDYYGDMDLGTLPSELNIDDAANYGDVGTEQIQP